MPYCESCASHVATVLVEWDAGDRYALCSHCALGKPEPPLPHFHREWTKTLDRLFPEEAR